jgi:LysM repeat protein
MPQYSNARILAPVALVSFVMAVILVAAVSMGGDDAATAPAPEPATRSTSTPQGTASTPAAGRSGTSPAGAAARTTTVQAGETPATIAARAGITVDELLRLNPDVDPRALRIGQTLEIEP